MGKLMEFEGLEQLLGQDVQIVTKSGSRREGHLTSFRYSEAPEVNGRQVRYPEGVILNREETDPIPWNEIATIDIE